MAVCVACVWEAWRANRTVWGARCTLVRNSADGSFRGEGRCGGRRCAGRQGAGRCESDEEEDEEEEKQE